MLAGTAGIVELTSDRFGADSPAGSSRGRLCTTGFDEAPVAVPADLGEMLSDLIAHHRVEGWQVRLDDVWAHADYGGTTLPRQGWKLHVSATEASAGEMLRACAPVLLEARCPFKIARDGAQVRALTSPHCPRGNAGKVLTVYPRSDGQAVDIAHRLDAATRGLRGPRILNDQPLHDASIVHYRYGVFTGTPLLAHDGEFSLALVTPDGEVVPDVRAAGFRPPPWVTDPFRRGAPTPSAAASSGQVLLADRFVVREAIRHANRGGVFRAQDTRNGASVVVKQARAHVAADAHGRDARDRLRHEWSMLELLADTQLVPRPIALFEQGSDVFLVEEDLAAPNLRSWTGDALNGVTVGPAAAEVLELLGSVTSALTTLHARGVVLRDLSPNNILVRPGLKAAFVDPELAMPLGGGGDLCRGSGTVAYASPEQLAGEDAHPAVDLHALGAVILFAFTGEDPLVGADGSTSLRDWMHRGRRPRCLPPGVADLALRLCGDAASRPGLTRVSAELRAVGRSVTAHRWILPDEGECARLALDESESMEDRTADVAIDALLDRLLWDIAAPGERISRASTFGEATLPTNVQHGAAGLLGVLLQAGRLRGDSRALQAAARVARWIERVPVPRGGAVGLHFGHAGPAWALAEAGEALGDRGLLDRAVERALAVPDDFPGPDVTQGVAGLGLTAVRLWELTGDERVRARIEAIARDLSRSAERDGTGVSWRTPPHARSAFAGKRFHGFAHGTAGIGTFLRYAADVLDDARLLELSIECADTIVHAALSKPDGRLLWASSPEEPAPGLPHWCNGSSGVATFLVRMLAERDLPDVLDGAARTMVAAKWQSGVAYCHGLSGNADTLLDLADALGGNYRSQAADLLRLMWDRRQVDAEGVGLTDEPDRITPDFAVGYSGGLSALLRLRLGGPRLWLPVGR